MTNSKCRKENQKGHSHSKSYFIKLEIFGSPTRKFLLKSSPSRCIKKTVFSFRLKHFQIYDCMNINLQDDDHPVKVGLSDAYIIDRTIYCEYKLPNHMFELKLSSCSTEDYL